jgi:Tol biopolymer transport system component
MKGLDELHRYAAKDDERLEIPAFDQLPLRMRESRSPERPMTRSFGALAIVVASVVVVTLGAIQFNAHRLTEPDATQPATVAASGAPTTAAQSLQADAASFRGQGRLAFVTGGVLRVLDGATGELHVIDTNATDPQWSASGSWLAYGRANGPALEVWLSRADGSGKELVRVPGVTSAIYRWSPTDDVLAVIPQGLDAKGLWLARPGRGVSELAAGDVPVWSLAWSPDGQMLAYSSTLPFTDPVGRSDGLFTVRTQGESPTQRLTATADGILGISWWPDGRGLLYLRDLQHSASLLADGVPFESLSLDGSRRSGAFPLQKIDASANDWIDLHRFVAVVGGGRELTSNKEVALCDIETLSCDVLARATGVVSLQPALSPDRARVAFVRAPDRGNLIGFASASEAEQWMNARTLWIVDLRSGTAAELTNAGRMIFAPTWSPDGQRLLLTHDQTAWFYSLSTGASSPLIKGLDAATPFGGYGWVFAWQR